MNREFPDEQAGFRKDRRTRDQTANIHWIMEKAREFQKNIYIYVIDCAKISDYVDHNALWKLFKEMGVPDHLTCLLIKPYVGQEARGPDMEQLIGSEYDKAVYCHSAYVTYWRVHYGKGWAGWNTLWNKTAGGKTWCQERLKAKQDAVRGTDG